MIKRAKFLGLILFTCFFCIACKGNRDKKLINIVQQWQGRKVVFPENMVFTRLGTDTIEHNFSDADYKILVYVDSTGCTACNLQLDEWKTLIAEIDTITNNAVSFLFFFQLKDKREAHYLLRIENFDYPVYIDYDGQLNVLNNLPSEKIFHTFLLNKENRVIALGNPLHNPGIKNLYLENIMSRKVANSIVLTTADSI